MADLDSLTIQGLRLVPRKGLSRGMRRLAKVRSKMAVRRFAARFDLAMHEAEHPVDHYESVLDLFTRRLKPGVRPVDPDPKALVSPVDGAYLIGGDIVDGALLQAKGRDYSVAALLAAEDATEVFGGGSYITVYLSPRDYHRIHSPVDGEIVGYTQVPGDLFPVNAAGVQHVDALFATNERVSTRIQTEAFGRVEVVKVGATNVGHIKLSYDDAPATNTGDRGLIRHDYPDSKPVARADELGVFELGSTVIVVTERRVRFEDFTPGQGILLGTRLGTLSE